MQNPFSSRQWARALTPGVIILITLLLAFLAGTVRIGPRDFLIIIIAIGLMMVIVSVTKLARAIHFLFYFWIVLLAVGWRGLWISQDLRFYAPELLIWALFFFIITMTTALRLPINIYVPRPLLIIVLPFGLLALYNALNRGIVSVDVAWAEYKDYLMLIPVFAVTYWQIPNMDTWRKAGNIYAITMIGIAILGIIEYVTGTSLNIFGSVDVAVTNETQQGFVRALFSFWGHPSVIILIILALAFILPMLYSKESPAPLALGSVIAILLAVYAAGHRGGWLAVGALLIIFAVLALRRRWPILLFLTIGLLILPSQFYNDLQPIIFGLDKYADSSIEKRVSFSTDAIQMIQAFPLNGNGWGMAGWVHNEYLQLAGNAGLIALAIYVYWFIQLGWKLFRLAAGPRASPDPRVRVYAGSLLATLIALMFMMVAEVIISIAPLAVGFWCFLALADRFVSLNREATPQKVNGIRQYSRGAFLPGILTFPPAVTPVNSLDTWVESSSTDKPPTKPDVSR